MTCNKAKVNLMKLNKHAGKLHHFSYPILEAKYKNKSSGNLKRSCAAISIETFYKHLKVTIFLNERKPRLSERTITATKNIKRKE